MLNKNGELTPIARVNNSYLYQEDIEDIFSEGLSESDSIVLVTNYINKWATQQLLIDGAAINLNEDKQKEFEKLVDQYRKDLISKAYLEALVKQNIDTIVSLQEATDFYESNKENFKLNEELIKFRYINVDENISDISEITRRFKRFNQEDREVLDSIAIQFKNYSLNDSIWVKVNQVISKISAVTIQNKSRLLKKSNFIQLKDSLGLYLMQINEVLLRNEIAPLEYIKPTIDQIVINRRKLELVKQLEKDITKDAIENNKFEIFD
ncbi:MAG: peptidyl-prolyl cis-trans isomerase [Bacteroidia bacterium]|nr:peptidyl-prolyl cis-trans isomerase [Bacteroidia bacterium]NND09663.1 peptidyl-prolyl cis-trans isomerase [Flavobacteriaceae bacterium]MBT8310882.1 peptidyl-prolyl cis-trans isomerase [Bacteroidia bacterium]NNK28757.1 peptidyl-prolyl cis-trans isomerase [Flavobacteriaceae bacterium]NNL61637.1 peptidyl-prolyl cis-trans isomerase [Flavobacteriaceae bacterium]